MLKNKKLLIGILVVLMALSLTLVACNPDQPDDPTEKFQVSFSVDGTVVSTQEVEKNTRITQPADPTFSDPSKVFTAWYTDAQFYHRVEL